MREFPRDVTEMRSGTGDAGTSPVSADDPRPKLLAGQATTTQTWSSEDQKADRKGTVAHPRTYIGAGLVERAQGVQVPRQKALQKGRVGHKPHPSLGTGQDMGGRPGVQEVL